MKEKPILFSGSMVQAILDGRKTQTRRVINPQPQREQFGEWSYFKSKRSLFAAKTWQSESAMRKFLPRDYSPYGQPGDTLWVRETWGAPGNYDHIKPSELMASEFDSSLVVYRATAEYGDVYYKWRPSIYMPRWASRITLRVKSVRVERVQDISEEDALAEGVPGARYFLDGEAEQAPMQKEAKRPLPVWRFMLLWEKINSKRGFGWDANPFVFVVEFEMAEVGYV